jgi:Mn2+/Fe2+ NRAMP family transporter
LSDLRVLICSGIILSFLVVFYPVLVIFLSKKDKKMKKQKPQTQIFSKGYDPQLSEGAAVPPFLNITLFSKMLS